MDNGQIYDFCVTILRKEKEGSAVSPARFTLMLIAAMWEKINFEFSQFELSQIVTDTLKALKTTETIAITAGGDFDLTTLTDDYLHPTTLTYTDTGARIRSIDILTDAEWADRQSDSLITPTATFPIAKIVGDTIFFDPLVSVNAEFTFLKKPTEPFFDYYWDANDDIIYMPEGSSHTLGAGEMYRDGTTVGLVNSISVELPFPDQEKIDVAYKILSKLGVPIQETMAAQYAISREQKEESL